MVPTHPTSRSLVRSTLLALVLAVATVAVAVGRDAATDTAPSDGLGGTGRAAPVVVSPDWVDPEPAPRYDTDLVAARVALVPVEAAATAIRPHEAHEVQAAPAGTKATAKVGAVSPARLRGRNHVWMPALRIDRSISFYSCSNTSYPGNRVYRWGCAGSDNVYLFGHAGGVFKPLHDAYVAGRLRKGTPLYYADGHGTVHTYRIAWWKLTTPTAGTWAYASQTRSSLTLQTCVGAQSQYRLIVRLIEVG